MKTIRIWNDRPSEKQAEEIAAALRDGEIAVIPTDTIYAIVCDALNPKAVDRICRLKDLNPAKATLSILCSDISMAADYTRIDNDTYRLMRANTPGPFTFLLRALSGLPRAFKNRKEVGVRIPDSETARMIARHLGNPVMTTSIEFEDDDYAREPDLIEEAYEGNVEVMVKGEEGGTVPSTIVDCTGSDYEICRQGLGELQ